MVEPHEQTNALPGQAVEQPDFPHGAGTVEGLPSQLFRRSKHLRIACPIGKFGDPDVIADVKIRGIQPEGPA
jgi:hypothetical protein